MFCALNKVKGMNINMRKIVSFTLGTCPCCGKKTIFVALDYWFRDYYQCLWCRSIPRQRAIMSVIKEKIPEYKTLKMHESSPSGAVFRQLKKECNNYSYSYFYDSHCLGKIMGDGSSNQDLENLTFESNTFDVFITQDVMEHVNRPEKAFSEIARVLKQGGVHVFTTPLYRFQKTRPRIKIENNQIINILPEIYHGNPIDENGSLVTYDWGYDIGDFIEKNSGMHTEIVQFPYSKANYRSGLNADFLEVMVSRKM